MDSLMWRHFKKVISPRLWISLFQNLINVVFFLLQNIEMLIEIKPNDELSAKKKIKFRFEDHDTIFFLEKNNTEYVKI